MEGNRGFRRVYCMQPGVTFVSHYFSIHVFSCAVVSFASVYMLYVHIVRGHAYHVCQ